MRKRSEQRKLSRKIAGYRRRAGLNGGEVRRLQQYVYAVHNGVCQRCGVQCNPRDYYTRGSVRKLGATYPTLQHVLGLAQGGTWATTNIMLYCYACNKRDNRERLMDA